MSRSYDDYPDEPEDLLRRDLDAADLSRIADNDPSGLTGIYNRYLPDIRSYAYRHSDSPEAAEDLVQDTFTNFYRNQLNPDNKQVDAYDERGGVPAFLTRIATNKHTDNIRVGKRRPVAPDSDTVDKSDTHLFMSEPVIPEQAALDRIESEALNDAINQLPPKQRGAVVGRFIKGLSGREIAEEMGGSEITARTNQRRGLERLRGILGGSALDPNVDDEY